MADHGAIRLPEWYAACAWHDAPRKADPRESGASTLQLGPFTIYRADEGCDTATFGSSSAPGVVIFDGYLFDRRSLKRELSLPPETPDAAVVAAAYVRWRADVLDRIDGSYLVAIWDPGERRLLLGHDPLGHHPVFYAARADALWFTSNVLALPRSGAVPADPNRVSLALAALRYWPSAGETFFEHVRRLRPGSCLTATGSGLPQTHAYWSPWLDDDEPGLSEAEARGQFEPVLVSAIERCMELAPEGIMLSGGLDSVAIAALAADSARAHGIPLVRAVSGRRDRPAAMLDPLSDEEPMQTAVTRALHMDHLVAYESQWTGRRPSIELSLEAVRDLPGPSRIYWVGAYMAFYRFVAGHGIHTALTGSGGDNWVGVSDAFAADAMRHLRLRDLSQHMRSWMGTGGLTFTQAAHHLLWSGGVRLLLDAWSARLVPGAKEAYHRRRAWSAMPAWLCPDATLKQAVAAALIDRRPAALTPEGRVPRNFYRHAQRGTVNPYYQYEFEVGFHVESSCGLRLLSPYHDRTVVRFLNSIPPRVLLDGASYKGMLRPVAQKRLPSLGLEAQRKVYGADIMTSHLDELRNGIASLWRDRPLARLASLGILDEGAVRQALAPSGDSGFEHLMPVYALLSAEQWLAAHCAST